MMSQKCTDRGLKSRKVVVHSCCATFSFLVSSYYNQCFKVFKTKRKERASTEGKEDSEEGDWKRLKVGC